MCSRSTTRCLVADLYETMAAYNGLAANQSAWPSACSWSTCPTRTAATTAAVVNPVLDQRRGEKGEEGACPCPASSSRCSARRAWRARLDERAARAGGDGLPGARGQHETDHLDGVLFTDRLSPLKRQFLKRDLDALARGELPAGYHPGAREGKI
jgi:peptide deformylase